MDREDVINKVFPHSLFGYDPVAVDAFLDEVIREFDRMTNTIDVLQFRLAQELSEAKQNNDILAAELHRQGYESRVEQVDIDIIDAEPQPETAEDEPPEPEPAPEAAAEEQEPAPGDADGDPFAGVLEREAEAEASVPVREIAQEDPSGERKKRRERKRRRKKD